MDCHHHKVDSIKKGVGAVCTWNSKTLASLMRGTHKQAVRIMGFIRESSNEATHQLHYTGREGISRGVMLGSCRTRFVTNCGKGWLYYPLLLLFSLAAPDQRAWVSSAFSSRTPWREYFFPYVCSF